jgi:hypothetical protein
VRNEPNWAGPRGKCAKQSQTWEDWGIWAKIVVSAVALAEGKCAEQTQFPPCGQDVRRGRPTHSTIAQGRLYEECKTNPICLPGAGLEKIVQNKAKLAGTGAYRQRWLSRDVARPGSHPRQTNPISARRGRSPEGKCAKQTQFRPPAEGVGRGRSTHEECETKPIGECQVATSKEQVSGQRSPACCPLTSPFKPQTSHFPKANAQNKPNL